jgi:hypothetical protein
MRTTLDLPDPLFKEVKTRAVQQGVTLKELLAIYIEAGLRNPSAAKTNAPADGKHHALPVGIPRVPDTPLHPAMTNAEIYAILDTEDLGEYTRAIAQSSITD